MRTNTDITLYRKVYDETTHDNTWGKIVINKASWFSGQKTSLSSSKYDKFTIRVFVADLNNQYNMDVRLLRGESGVATQDSMPKDSANVPLFDIFGNLNINEGDFVARGVCEYALPSQARESLPQHDCFDVISTAKNTRGSYYTQHWKIEGV